MLDQNTDRMWYVIGAILVGAAILFGFNTFMPNAFASVSNNMATLINKVDVHPNRVYLTDEDLVLHGDVQNLDSRSRQWSFDAGLGKPTWMITGFKHYGDALKLPYGAKGEMGFDVWIPEGFDGVAASVDVNMYPEHINGWYGNDNDNGDERLLNGEKTSFRTIPIEAGEWNTIRVTVENSHSGNVEQVPIVSRTGFGIARTQESVDEQPTIPVKIRNIYIEVFE